MCIRDSLIVKADKGNTLVIMDTDSYSRKAVSYTHLDVYKRQLSISRARVEYDGST